MAKRGSQLPTATEVGAPDEFILVQGGTTKKVTFSTINDESGLTPHVDNEEIHAPLDDNATDDASLWSAEKIIAELAEKAEADHVHDDGDGLTGILPISKGGTGRNSISAKKLFGAQSADTPAEIGMGTGLDMSATNLIVVPDTTVQQVNVAKNGSLVSSRWRLNYIEGNNIGITMVDDPTNNEADITFNLALPLTTNGDLLIQDAGIPARLGVGSDGQVLTVVSGAPAWSTGAASGLELLADTGAISAGTTGVTFTTAGFFTSTYASLLLKIIDLLPTDDSRNLHIVGSIDGGVGFLAGTSYDFAASGRNSSGTGVGGNGAGVAQILLNGSVTIGSNTNEGITGNAELFAPYSAAHKSVIHHTINKNVSTALQMQAGGGSIKTTSAINALRVLFSSASTIASGRVLLYGIRA